MTSVNTIVYRDKGQRGRLSRQQRTETDILASDDRLTDRQTDRQFIAQIMTDRHISEDATLVTFFKTNELQ